MEPETMFSAAAFAIAAVALVSASISDWRIREVSDIHWVIMGISGIAIFTAYSIYVTGFRWEYICLVAASLMILVDITYDREFNTLVFYAMMAVLFILPLYGNMSDPTMIAWASIPICYLIFMGMYTFDIIRGGADAKCLIVLSMMFPLYPSLGMFPVIPVSEGLPSEIFIFTVSVLFVAAICTLPVALYFALRNTLDGYKDRRIFSGYRMKIKDARGSKVWPIEDIVNGEPASIGIPEDDERDNILDRLESYGREDVLITPMIPFVIMLAAATMIVALVGSPLFLIL